jgi:CRP-like cAMP-binding protein
MSERIEEIRQMLDDIGLTKNLDSELRDRLLGNMRLESFAAGDIVFHEREKGDKIYIVESGQIAIKKSIDWARAKELTIDYCEPGDFFGEMAVFEQATRSARAEATEDTRLLVIDGAIFIELMKDNPEKFTTLLFSMIKILSNRLRMTHMKLITFYEIGHILSGNEPVAEVATKILETLLISTELKHGALLVYNPFNQLMEFSALTGLVPLHPDMRGLQLSGVLKQAMDKGQTMVLDVSFIDDNLKNLLGGTKSLAWILIAPMKVEHDPIGFIILVKKEDFAPFHKGEVLLLSAISKQVSLEIMSARMKQESVAREKFRRVYFRDVI